jgi:hypothetical protein
MRRAFLAVTFGAVLLTGAACDSDAEPTAGGPSAVAAAPTPVPTVSAEDYSADTRKVCDAVQKVFDDDLAPFGAALGKMITFKEAKLPKEAEKSEAAAVKQLKVVATRIVGATEKAQDPAIMMAGKASADKFTLSAADKKLLDTVKTEKDVNRFIDGKMGEWLTPISGYCA